MPDIPGLANIDDTSSHTIDLLRKIYIEQRLTNLILSVTQGFTEDPDQHRTAILNDLSLNNSAMDDQNT